MKNLLTIALLVTASPAGAAISASQTPLPIVRAVAAPLVVPELMVVGNQKTEELPLECRGYYVRPQKQIASTRCN
jgi:hypothetical protein